MELQTVKKKVKAGTNYRNHQNKISKGNFMIINCQVRTHVTTWYGLQCSPLINKLNCCLLTAYKQVRACFAVWLWVLFK